MSYPLLFRPVYKEKIWGGRLLETQLKRQLPPGKIGESWEISAHPNGISVVENGPWADKALDDLIKEVPQEILGVKESDEFPLLIKFIDANSDLSVQVHPDNEFSLAHEGQLGKTEMWYVLAAKPGAEIVYGLQPGTTRETFAEAIGNGTVEQHLNKVPVKAGDVFHIPSGLVHALGSGVMVAEVQQSSDVVYRVFDYNRRDDQGNLRELHVDKALAAIDYSAKHNPVSSGATLISCEYFVVNKIEKSQDKEGIPLEGSFHILINLGDTVEVQTTQAVLKLPFGRSCLIPAGCGSYSLVGQPKLLQVRLP